MRATHALQATRRDNERPCTVRGAVHDDLRRVVGCYGGQETFVVDGDAVALVGADEVVGWVVGDGGGTESCRRYCCCVACP